MAFLLLIFGFLLQIGSAYNQNPKIYIDVDCISFADPLLNGFNVILPKELFVEHLTRHNNPLIYYSAIPLSNRNPAKRDILYLDDMPDKLIHLEGLAESAWYYICVEFETTHRHQRVGNTSTSCELYRTLDKFGKQSDSVVTDVKIGTIWDTGMEFKISASVDAPMELGIFLEGGAGAQLTFFVMEPKKNLAVIFHDLVPGFNYGRFCVREIPIHGNFFTAMGRPVSVPKIKCYFQDLKTAPVREPSVTLPLQNNARNARTAKNRGNFLISNFQIFSIFQIFIFFSFNFYFFNLRL